ncbi:hypothetical protein, partial [Sphingomonas sp. FUKUSWIS1]|uniref:hypothetical protein n=1 Tax=Sphingomonas sp. FUKUSWIS1 TaxID=1379701 RepID=UPI001F1B12E9
SSPVARQAHNLKVTGSNPVPATTDIELQSPPSRAALSVVQRIHISDQFCPSLAWVWHELCHL